MAGDHTFENRPRYDETKIETDPVRIFWLDEMTQGYMDGRKVDCPEPSGNRSASYRHGFANGRDDRARSPRAPASVLRELAEVAITHDIAASSPVGGLPDRPPSEINAFAIPVRNGVLRS